MCRFGGPGLWGGSALQDTGLEEWTTQSCGPWKRQDVWGCFLVY